MDSKPREGSAWRVTAASLIAKSTSEAAKAQAGQAAGTPEDIPGHPDLTTRLGLLLGERITQ